MTLRTTPWILILLLTASLAAATTVIQPDVTDTLEEGETQDYDVGGIDAEVTLLVVGKSSGHYTATLDVDETIYSNLQIGQHDVGQPLTIHEIVFEEVTSAGVESSVRMMLDNSTVTIKVNETAVIQNSSITLVGVSDSNANYGAKFLINGEVTDTLEEEYYDEIGDIRVDMIEIIHLTRASSTDPGSIAEFSLTNTGPQPSCSDSDGGDVFTRGETTVDDMVFTDYCSSGKITEYFCHEGTKKSFTVNCVNGCHNGQCVDQHGYDQTSPGYGSRAHSMPEYMLRVTRACVDDSPIYHENISFENGYWNYQCENRKQSQCYSDGSFDTYYDEECVWEVVDEQPVEIPQEDMTIGNPHARIHIEIWVSPGGEFVKRWWNDIWPVIREDYVETGKARITVRFFPLHFHEHAETMSAQAVCEAAKGNLQQYLDKVLTGQETVDTYSQWSGCPTEAQARAFVDAELASAARNGVTGTPTVFIDGHKIVGAQPLSVFLEALQPSDDVYKGGFVVDGPATKPEPVDEGPIEHEEDDAPGQSEHAPGQQAEADSCDGCKIDGQCLPIGTRVSGEYCDIGSNLQDQKAVGNTCDNDHECVTNECSSGVCTDLSKELSEQRDMLEVILSWLSRWF